MSLFLKTFFLVLNNRLGQGGCKKHLLTSWDLLLCCSSTPQGSAWLTFYSLCYGQHETTWSHHLFLPYLCHTFLVINGSHYTVMLACLWYDSSVVRLMKSQISCSLGYYLRTDDERCFSQWWGKTVLASHADEKEEQLGQEQKIANRKKIIPCVPETNPRGTIS